MDQENDPDIKADRAERRMDMTNMNLYEMIVKLNNAEEARRFFEELCYTNELQNLVNRYSKSVLAEQTKVTVLYSVA